MAYLEMSRDVKHGGGSWKFKSCVWAPQKKRNGHSWVFWSKIQNIRRGDVVFHLRGKKPETLFVGYSIASGDGAVTAQRPPEPGQWGFANRFYRADLEGFVAFDAPINLYRLFAARKSELMSYLRRNNSRGQHKKNVFYVWQSQRLQCVNGGYLSDVEDDLSVALFGGPASEIKLGSETVVSVRTRSQIRLAESRIGQSRFAQETKEMYGLKCCFPGCSESDSRFLVASHIARWADNEELRGHLGNALCLCVVHDRAFEVGVFTLDEQFRVYISQNEKRSGSKLIQSVVPHHGNMIRLGRVTPLEKALAEHRNRVGIEP